LRKTDWTKYYQSPFKTAAVTRKITCTAIMKMLKKHIHGLKGLSLIELGGANSAFFEVFIRELEPCSYTIIDNNCAGLEKTRQKIRPGDHVHLLNRDLLTWQPDIPEADLVISTGLIEHFDLRGTAGMIRAHFDLAKPEGHVLMTFPTPTVMYRTARIIAEQLGMWIFHDERPLTMHEVGKTAQLHGTELERGIIWPIVLTQGIVLFKKDIHS
jgi:cyclopropane fatty-acyl-phospholipid synthase-like methyltransferase